MNDPRSLASAIARNRKRLKYRAILRRIFLRTFEYQDSGRGDKAKRVMNRIRDLL